MPRVKHIREPKEPNDVYIGRPSKWGNPFSIGSDGNRAMVIEKHQYWFNGNTTLFADIHELKGKNLVCYCAPLGCHGDTLLELARESLK